ncbi:MAG: tetratricopeptide repeat protein [Alphaproteobacteria bacterium]|nr:tetratricopeptide repeat protein [Alphaproteobacteria bacterium]
MKKTKNVRKTTKTPAVKQAVVKDSCNNVWSWTIYVYWFIILFFIAATFYIIGRGQERLHPTNTNVVITETSVDTNSLQEEKLLQTDDYINSAKEKLFAGNMEDAIKDLNVVIENAATSNLYALRGEAYMQTGDYQKALNDFNSAIEMDSMNAVAYYDRYLLDTRLENYDAALTDINNALSAQSVKPVDILNMRDLYAKRGQLNLWLKNWQGAIADYTNSLARSEGSISANVYAERAEAYTALGNFEEAVNDYTSAVRIISEQIQAAPTQEERESQSSNAMGYFEKSAALNLKMDKIEAAKSDLNSAYQIAMALNDEESVKRIQNLLNGLE